MPRTTNLSSMSSMKSAALALVLTGLGAAN
jgi:hypothetical protein